MTLKQEMMKYLDSQYAKAKELGKAAAGVFDKNHKSQIRGLENAVFSAGYYAVIYNFIENQMGKDDKKRFWSSGGNQRFGDRLLAQYRSLASMGEEIAGRHPESDALQVKLDIAREWTHQFVSLYLYERLGENG